MMLRFSTTLSVLAVLAQPALAQTPDRWQPIRDSIERQLVRAGGAAMAVAVAKDGKIIWDKAILAPLGEYWESLHPKNRWGGNFSNLVDCPHFERVPKT